MAYGDELVRVSVLYRLISEPSWAQEEAIITFHLQHVHREGNPFSWPTEMEHLPEQLYNKWIAHWAPMAAIHNTHAQIQQFKCAHIDALGHTLHEGAFDVTDGSLTGSRAGGLLPPEVAVTVSEWAYEPGSFAALRGRKRGRFYLPYIASATSTSSGRLATGERDAFCAAYQALFDDLMGMQTFEAPPLGFSDYWTLVTASKVDAEVNLVAWVSIDDKFDSQRRREHQAPAARVVLPVTGP